MRGAVAAAGDPRDAGEQTGGQVVQEHWDSLFSRMLTETLGQTSQHRFSTNEEKAPGLP